MLKKKKKMKTSGWHFKLHRYVIFKKGTSPLRSGGQTSLGVGEEGEGGMGGGGGPSSKLGLL